MYRDGQIDWEKLDRTVQWSIRFLDNVIDVSKYPLPEVETMVKKSKNRLGRDGLGRPAFKLRIPYNSTQAIQLAEKVMSFIQEKSINIRLNWPWKGQLPNIENSIYQGQPMRNATCTTIAPTGTISMIAGTTSGIEPVFSLAFSKNVLDGERLIEVNQVFEECLNDLDPRLKEEIIEKVAATGNLKEMTGIPEEWKRVFVTALEIEPEYHIRMQAAFQKHCDNAVSKTVNFPFSATEDDVRQVYLLAYQLGCKGVTVYRSGSRTKEVLTVGKEMKNAASSYKKKIYPRSRPKQTHGVTSQVKTGCGKMYITVNSDHEGLIETFITTGSSGGCSGFTEGVSRLISLALRANIAPEAIIDQLTSASCPNLFGARLLIRTW